MAKNTTKVVSIDTVVVDTKTNVRLANNYDLPAMKQSILDVGRIMDPIHARICDNVVLRGNRRAWAGQELLADPTTPQEVAAALKKVTVVFHDVVPGSAEEMAVILDDGLSKPLGKTEILLAVWRMDKMFLSEIQIISAMYLSLSRYTDNSKKAAECAAITNLKDREKYLRSWLHGTVGGYMLAAAKMGSYVREQMVKTHLSDDHLLPTGETVEMRVSRGRVTELSAAKSKDDPKNGGAGWDVTTGGVHFNALIEKFKAEDKGEGSDEDKKKRPSVKELRDRAEVFKSPAIRAALLTAAGEAESGRALVDLDDQMARFSMVIETLQKRVNEIGDPKVKALVKAIIDDRIPAGEVELALNDLNAK